MAAMVMNLVSMNSKDRISMARNQKKIKPEDAIRQSLGTHEADFLVDNENRIFRNLFYGLEMYVPDCYGTDKTVVRQLLGNFGAYANTVFSNDVTVVMLDDRLCDAFESGNADSDTDAVCRTVGEKAASVMILRESKFIEWTICRASKFPDKSTISLLWMYGVKTVFEQHEKPADEVVDASAVNSAESSLGTDRKFTQEQFELF